MNALESSSTTRPYLIRAIYEWCTDNGLTPYVAVQVDETVQVPREYVKEGEIVLNISFDATSALKLGNDFIEFSARFAGTARQIMVPIGRVIAVYARENGQGMAFPVAPPVVTPGGSVERNSGLASLASVPDSVESLDIEHLSSVEPGAAPRGSEDGDSEPPRPGAPRPALKRVK